MRASGNGNTDVCVSNLLHIVRGEVAFDRVRGRDPELVEHAADAEDIIADAEWVLETYETRVQVDEITVDEDAAKEGDFPLSVKISDIDEEDEEDEEE